MKYAVVIEKAGTNFSGYVPDLPGCVVTGHTAADVSRELRKAVEFHLQGLKEDGQTVPEATSAVEYIEVAA